MCQCGQHHVSYGGPYSFLPTLHYSFFSLFLCHFITHSNKTVIKFYNNIIIIWLGTIFYLIIFYFIFYISGGSSSSGVSLIKFSLQSYHSYIILFYYIFLIFFIKQKFDLFMWDPRKLTFALLYLLVGHRNGIMHLSCYCVLILPN